MLRASRHFALYGSIKDSMFGLWNKPETKDSRVKEYIPEVLEESLAEQRAVLEESSSRDVIVELGHKVLRAIENKAPTPSIAPNLNTILKEFGATELINQRALSYLLYPTSAASTAGSHHLPELVTTWTDNFRAFIGQIEEAGSAVHIKQKLLEDAAAEAGEEGEGEKKKGGEAAAAAAPTSSSTNVDDAAAVPTSTTTLSGGFNKLGPVAVGDISDEPEPFDVSMLAKLSAGMALANIQISDNVHAIKCVDFALTHSTDRVRRGGLYGMKAGILNKMKKYDEASQAAALAIEASDNVQGYLQGAAALRLLKKDVELVALLEKGTQAHPSQQLLAGQLEKQKEAMGLQITE